MLYVSSGVLFSTIYLRFFARALFGNGIFGFFCFLVCFAWLIELVWIISAMLLFGLSMSYGKSRKGRTNINLEEQMNNAG